MLSTNTAFDAKHDVDYKTPMYIIDFDGEHVGYCDHVPANGGYLGFDGQTGSFSAGDTIKQWDDDGSELASATILRVIDDGSSGYLILENITGTFQDNKIFGVESYGGELSTDGNCEADPGSWNDCATPTINERSNEQAHGGTYSRKFAGNAAYDGVESVNATTTANAFYVASFWLYGDGTNEVTATIYHTIYTNFSGMAPGENYIPPASWIQHTVCFQASTTTCKLLVRLDAGETAGTHYIDDYSIKKITNAALANGILQTTYKQYLKSISGLSQKVNPEEGRASIGGITFELQDYNDEITALLATDTYYFHRKKTTVKAGYMGMDETDMLTIMVGWVTGLKLNKDGLSYVFNITDPIKWMQRKIFRGSEDVTVTLSGNPLNILLACLTSGSGSGNYDWYASANGLGLDPSYINVTAIEEVRDNWFPGDSHYMRFTINERIKAKDFFEKEIFKPLNLYPVIDGQGRFSVKPFKPPLAALESVQAFNKDNIIGLPQWDANLSALVNEVEVQYDWDDVDEEFDTEVFYVDSTSVNNRGPGKKPITIKTKGLHTSHSPASIVGRATDILTTRKQRIFGRFSTPPIKLSFNTFFSRWLSEAGDIVPFTHSLIPDIAAGTRGYTAERMEIINKTVDWKRGRVKVNLLNTGFAKSIYGVISPTMAIVSASDGENFVVSAADAAKYANLTSPEVQLCDSKMRQRKASVTLLTVNTTTGACTCDDMGVTPNAGDMVLFADYDDCTSEQKNWGFIADSSNDLGTANDDAHLITP